MTPLTLFVDTNVIIKALTANWGAAKAVLIRGTLRILRITTSDGVREEVEGWLGREGLAADYGDEYAGLVRRLGLRVVPSPTAADVERGLPDLLPVIRHRADVAVVIAAMQAAPDWVVSENERHFNPRVAERTGLRIVTPQQFLAEVVGQPADRG